MLEPPSASLLKTLSAMKLCEPRDLRKCRGLVKRLTRDLPAFDSIWIDALVQTRRLTAFQAHCLETDRAAQLLIGPCLLLERLGGSSQADTFLVRCRDTNDVGVLKLSRITPEQVRSVTERMEYLVAESTAWQHPSVVLPNAMQLVEWPVAGDLRFVSISRYVPGPHLAELLIRRGRFPTRIVIEIGRQLLEALARLETHGLTHGDVGLSNVRITPKGQAVLVDAGLVSALRPEFSFHTILTAERYDGLAPERIINGSAPTSASDLYSLGCLLWTLLAGRSPFPVGDPLAKLNAHQTQAVGDVREWVPDAPDWLANLLLRWTALNPAQRPGSIREALADWRQAPRTSRSELKRFRGEFDRTVPRAHSQESSQRWPLTVAAVFAMTGAVLFLSDRNARSMVLSVTQPVTTRVSELLGTPTAKTEHHVQRLDGDASATNSALPDGDRTTDLESTRFADLTAPQPLPPPNRAGRIVLTAGTSYEAAEVSVRGTLELVGDPANPPRFVITDRAFSLLGKDVQVRHVRFVRMRNADAEMPSLLMADCQSLDVTGCTFELGKSAASPEAVRVGAAIAWRPLEPHQRVQTNLTLTDVAFQGSGPALFLQIPPASFEAVNVLKCGDGDLLHYVDPGRSDWRCEWRQLTARGHGSLLRCWMRNPRLPLSKLSLLAEGCVIDSRNSVEAEAADSTTNPSLVTWMTTQLPPRWDSSIEWNLNGVLVPQGLEVVTLVNPQTGQRSRVDDTRLEVGGLIGAPFQFVGPASSRPADSELRSFDAPLSTRLTMGIVAERLLPESARQ